MGTAIKIQNLSKKYIIGHQRQEKYSTFRDVLMHKFRGFGHRIRHPLSPNHEIIEQEELWALRDINLEILQGERVGIIGRNGAGKSTLLKLLSRITEPTEGRFSMYGRVASLLEVGTGFHPELSGRENIFLNGAILGMSKSDIRQKFDAIVAFAETERFLDTPVKRYSSGMYVRLAFAIAAHMEPEILIVDEVLAVGDLQFQNKCMGRMSEVAGEGRTVLFVSHNMGAIRALCKTGVLLNSGQMEASGNVNEIIDRYLQKDGKQLPSHAEFGHKHNVMAQISRVSVVNSENIPVTNLPHDQTMNIDIDISVNQNMTNSYLATHILNHELQTVLFSRYFISNEQNSEALHSGKYRYRAVIPAPLLVPGSYSVTVHLMSSSPPIKVDGVESACAFKIIDAGSEAAKRGMGWHGYIATPLKWSNRDII